MFKALFYDLGIQKWKKDFKKKKKSKEREKISDPYTTPILE